MAPRHHRRINFQDMFWLFDKFDVFIAGKWIKDIELSDFTGNARIEFENGRYMYVNMSREVDTVLVPTNRRLAINRHNHINL